MSRGLILFAHGARDARWVEPFEAVAARVRAAQPHWPVELAFLELMLPDLATAGARLAGRCDRIDVLPMFLGTGGHVRHDLPRLVDALRETHPATRFELHPPLGEMAAVIDAMADAAVDTATRRP